MEIERKWMVEGWPSPELPLLFEQEMRQGYISLAPTVRIREESMVGGGTEYVLCIKSPGLLFRQEIEISLEKETFDQLEDLIGLPLIPKTRRTYQLPDGLHLEVSHVDQGLPTEFWAYLDDEVTSQPGQSMGAYWQKTRMKESEN